MPIIEYEDMTIDVDDEGYLVNFEDWNEKVAIKPISNPSRGM